MTRTATAKGPGQKAHHTAKWARTMTKWLITYNRRTGARWNLVEFGGRSGAESRGIVDLVAIRKDHRHGDRARRHGCKLGDLFEIVLIQTKGGSANRPTPADRARLRQVARYHKATAVVLAEWRRGRTLSLFRLSALGTDWERDPVPASTIFG